MVIGYFASATLVRQRMKSIRQQSKSKFFRFGRTLTVKVHQSGIDVEEKILFRVENHVFAAKSLKASEGCINSSGKFP